MLSVDSFKTLDHFSNNGRKYIFYNLSKLEDNFPKIKNVPKSKKILIENLLRLEDGNDVNCLLYTSPSPRDKRQSRMPSSA